MTEFSQDNPVDHETIVGSYSPEIVNARDELSSRLKALKDKCQMVDTTGSLPNNLVVDTYDDGTVIVALGVPTGDFKEALIQYRENQALKSMHTDLTGTTPPGSDILVITWNPTPPQSDSDSLNPVFDLPATKVEWSNKRDEETVYNRLSIYSDGYVETASEVNRTELVHHTDASDFTREYASPSVRNEIPVIPLEVRPAELADIQNTEAQIKTTLVRYGIDLAF